MGLAILWHVIPRRGFVGSTVSATLKIQSYAYSVKRYSYSKCSDLPSTSTVLQTEYEYENKTIFDSYPLAIEYSCVSVRPCYRLRWIFRSLDLPRSDRSWLPSQRTRPQSLPTDASNWRRVHSRVGNRPICLRRCLPRHGRGHPYGCIGWYLGAVQTI